MLHQPPPDVDIEQLTFGQHPATRRLALEELLAHQLSLREVRLRIQADGAPTLPSGRSLQARFCPSCPLL
ncbi:hypothetical protein HORIV_72200 [Vreelandella olivaria]|uniref:Uncharacterized protein n=1 Tax=Vreelandella olivaria TaxID=390919 RepID=A0ABN5X6D0_9GAMM|nr:hypothetical protein HORIV_72200 [Halomonas olivaria]